ncbi:MAG: hypothetical protein Kow0092_17980 [Deferrisomatales bacterium]
MNRKTAHPHPDANVWTVADNRSRAEELAAWLHEGGVPARAAPCLEASLMDSPAVVLVDPTRWEATCRRTLEAFETRAAPPPAVVFTGPDPDVLFQAGPAYLFVPEGHSRRQFAAAVGKARRAWEKFRPYWPSPLGELPPVELHRVRSVLEERAGLEIRTDRESAFLQAVRCRMVARLTPTVRAYAGFLEKLGDASGETELLAGLLSVGETYFWRYAGQFRALQAHLIPGLVADKGRESRTLRIWSAGCATGEEVYSLAMACREAVPEGWRVHIVGTDIHRPSLAAAQQGVYGGRTLRNLPLHLQKKYMEPAPGGGRIAEPLREGVRFEFLNLADPRLGAWARAHGPFDAIFCRNTIIYFHRAAVDHLIETFEGALRAEGGLFLGPSETIYPRRAGLEPVRSMGCFFYRKALSPAPRRASRPPTASGDPRAADLYRSGLARLDAEDFPAAERRFRELVRTWPDDARGHTGLALLLANEGREGEACEHLGKAVRGEPVLAEPRFLQGLIAERRGEEVVALGHYRETLEVDPEFFMAHVNRAWILRRLGRRGGFVQEMHAALRILKTRPRIPRWATGGVGLEALMSLVAEALENGSEAR